MLKVSNIAVSLDEKDYAKVIANTLNIRKGGADNFLDLLIKLNSSFVCTH